MPTLLITGGAGFIGGHTATMAIQRGWQVRLLDNLSTGLATKSDRLASEGAEVIIGDVRDEAIVQAAVEGCDAVIHLAAQVSVPRSVEQPEETLENQRRRNGQPSQRLQDAPRFTVRNGFECSGVRNQRYLSPR